MQANEVNDTILNQAPISSLTTFQNVANLTSTPSYISFYHQSLITFVETQIVVIPHSKSQAIDHILPPTNPCTQI